MKSLIILLSIFVSSTVFAQDYYLPRRSKPSVTYDLSASMGSQDDRSYTELNLGLNWFITDWLNWRNAVFSRQGTGLPSVQGLDSSARLVGDLSNSDGTLGVDAFIGPGLRFATNEYNAVFGEAGLVFKLGGIRLGAGAKALHYSSDREINGVALPKDETQVFLIIGGSGAL